MINVERQARKIGINELCSRVCYSSQILMYNEFKGVEGGRKVESRAEEA